ncbi:hypothetical protein DACRYDRAFT_119063 [Dacryopinax primogenitus]|uniref:Uncharacterized protein n=1 Tax=Dacryopinax primogenitus (strain DJM 731) TaxID=1858805 RepID=M5FNR7_DACPD|nr:uncharacterized protein DACRYDRAFT_119063 [Dacryopinax primogenitus]EJT97845.1 hypothetical protein DACRYDRAFT_119063 [Dacryopinax primogenitus]
MSAVHEFDHERRSTSSDDSFPEPVTPPYLTPMSSYMYSPSNVDAGVLDIGDRSPSVTSLPLGPLITVDGRTQPAQDDPNATMRQKNIPGYGYQQTSPTRFFEPFPEGPIPAEQFRPRRGFIPSIHVPHEFALITLSEGNLVRMLGFDEGAVGAVREVLSSQEGEKQGVRSERRGKEAQHPQRRKSTDSAREGRVLSPVNVAASPVEGEMIEWCLEGKPWKERKNSSEIFFTSVISTLLKHSYHYVSPLNISAPGSPLHFSGIFSRSIEPTEERRCAFSVSFPAANIIRVIGAPRESTPGILAVVRQGWGQRLKEEKSEIGAWEGRLKGPGLFGAVPEPPGPEVVLETLAAFNRQGIELMTLVRLAGTEMWLFDCPASKEESMTISTST